ncbi:YadA family autotransporter adhesin, partial [Dyella silvatica]|uniref:YadA family autotransporter adhesin n=1 Tax=Dyella silvatica TaxID=2992128 RepID=UPI00225873A5
NGGKSVSIGSGNTATGDGAVAIGDPNTAIGTGAVAMGANNTAHGQGAVALGNTSAATGQGAVALGNASQAKAAGALAFGDSAVASNSGDVALGSGSVTAAAVATTSGTINGSSYNYAGAAPTSTVSVGRAGQERTITNVAAGQVTATSTDAVNGSQLFATNSAVTSLGTTVNTINNGGGIKYFHANSTLADSQASGANSVAVGPQAVAGGVGSVATGQGSTANGTNTVALGAGATTSKNGDVALGAGSVADRGAQSYTGKYSNAANNAVGTVSVGTAGAERTLSNVADAQNATDAVNLRQLDGAVTTANQYTDTQITHITGGITNGSTGMFQVSQDSNTPMPTVTGTKSTAGGAGAVASGANSTAVGNSAVATGSNSVALGANSTDGGRAHVVSVGSAGSERQVTNVAAGTQNTDAVNVSQLNASKAGSVQYDTYADGSINNSSVTLGNGGGPTTIRNVAPGAISTDAANVGQLTAVKDWSKSYTDQRFNTINSNLNTIGNRANAGVASAMAMASLPQAYQPNQSAAAVAVGSFHGESGIAVGVSTISESGRWVYKLNATSNTRGDTGVGVGAAMVW